LLSEFIETCQNRRIKVMFITTPVHHYYYEHIDPIKYQRMQDNLNQLVKNYHVTYLNFMKDSRFETVDFYNRDHLNASGVKKFSNILDPIINNELSHVD
jgi:hypothetical protein